MEGIKEQQVKVTLTIIVNRLGILLAEAAEDLAIMGMVMEEMGRGYKFEPTALQGIKRMVPVLMEHRDIAKLHIQSPDIDDPMVQYIPRLLIS